MDDMLVAYERLEKVMQVKCTSPPFPKRKKKYVHLLVEQNDHNCLGNRGIRN